MSTARLADATWPEVDQRVAAGSTTLLVPLGATEQHGPHLPIGTDTAIALALAEGAAAEVPGTVVAPVLSYGASGEHQDFAGTLSIGAEATELVLVELARSATETFDRVLFVNAHGGNATPLAAAVRRLRAESRDVRAWTPRLGGDAHAGRTETSLMLALEHPTPDCGRPPLTDAERMSTALGGGRPTPPPPGRGRPALPIAPEGSTAPDRTPERSTAVRADLAEAGNTAPLVDLIDDLRAGGVRAVSENGVLGDPASASAEEGRALLAAAIDDLRATLVAWPAAEPVSSGAAR
jgi:creatinine amidohydrolase